MPAKAVTPKPYVNRRAIFVLEHPDLGTAVINRTVFCRNKLIRQICHPLDECGPKGNLMDTAVIAMKRVFRTDAVKLHRCGMFQLRGLTERPPEQTVFHVDARFLNAYRLLPEASYQKLVEHHLRLPIEEVLEAAHVPKQQRAMG